MSLWAYVLWLVEIETSCKSFDFVVVIFVSLLNSGRDRWVFVVWRWILCFGSRWLPKLSQLATGESEQIDGAIRSVFQIRLNPWCVFKPRQCVMNLSTCSGRTMLNAACIRHSALANISVELFSVMLPVYLPGLERGKIKIQLNLLCRVNGVQWLWRWKICSESRWEFVKNKHHRCFAWADLCVSVLSSFPLACFYFYFSFISAIADNPKLCVSTRVITADRHSIVDRADVQHIQRIPFTKEY